MDNDFDRRDVLVASGPDNAEMAEPASPVLRRVPHFEKVEGWLKLPGAEFLFAAAASVRSGCIVEVGSYRGRSTVALCAGSMAGGKVPVYAIEPHEHFVGMKGGVFGPSDRRAFFRAMLLTKFASTVRLINASSEVVTPGWDKSVSLLYIDGDHRYEAVFRDFACWRPHLADRALVIFHDVAGAGPALLIKDLLAEGALTHLQTVGRLAMFSFHAVEVAVEPEAFPTSGAASVYPQGLEPTGPREGQTLHAIGEQVYFSARGNYLYQPIPKAGAMTIKRVLLELEGLAEAPDASAPMTPVVKKLSGTEMLTSQEEADLLGGRTDAFKFVFVRDPYTRLSVAYADKILGGYARGSHYWIKQIEDSAASQGITLSEPISFPQFVAVVAGQRGREMDNHWRHQVHCGRFDVIKYDFVGRFEMLTSDLTYVLERLGAPAEMMHRAIRPVLPEDSSLALWATVPAETRALFLKKFAIDFESLRYPMRFDSVLFAPVNMDRPPLVKLPGADGQPLKGAKRKRRVGARALAAAALAAPSGDGEAGGGE